MFAIDDSMCSLSFSGHCYHVPEFGEILPTETYLNACWGKP